MKVSKRAVILFVVVVVAMTAFSGCRQADEAENVVIESIKNQTSEIAVTEETDTAQTSMSGAVEYRITLEEEMYEQNELFLDFDNDLDFIYDRSSILDTDDLKGSILSTLEMQYPWFAIRKNKGRLYTIYSLSDGRLCYLEIQNSIYTGIQFYAINFVVYPFQDEEASFIYDFLLEKDYPENILASRD